MSNAEIKLSKETTVKNFATVVINGQERGKREINGGPSLLDFSTNLAQEFGITSFTVTVDTGSGPKPITTQSEAKAPVPSGATVGVSAKDSRGGPNDEDDDGSLIFTIPTIN